ncbi:MAG TPA: tripartite tricarboxylate transporter substrate binding protein [Burkholderiales bacterium]|nr:tripartite tricarboxylate transporter substrate binding protein [Burkholderiales bacterium]
MRIVALACAALLALSQQAPAQTQATSGWPDKPIRLVVSFAPGGVHDTLSRVLQPKLTEALGQPIVIENRAGAGGNIAAEAVAKSAPDGYTFLIASEAIATNEYLYRKLAYDPYKDLVPVAKLADYPMALIVHPSLWVDNVRDLVALAQAKPGSISYGSAGIGASGHLAGELFKSVADIDMVHVPYKGGAPALADLIAGRIQVMFLSVSLTVPQAKQGKVKVLAVTGRRRARELPDVPTTTEQGFPQVQALLFSSMLAPARTPAPIIARMNEVVVKALESPDVQKRLADLGAVPAPSSPDEFRKILRDEGERWGKLIREKNIRAD